MKNFYLTWISLLLLGGSALAQTPEITALITVTNATKITNAQSTLTVNGTARTWTNIPAFNLQTSIAFTNDGYMATTNLITSFQLYGAKGAGGLPVYARTNASNSFRLVGSLGDALTVSATPGYSTVSYSTNYYTNSTPYRIPFTLEPLQTRSNLISGAVDNLNKYSTNMFTESASVMGNFVGLTEVQTFGNKTLTNSTITGATISGSTYSGTISKLTNGYITNLVVDTLCATNFTAPGPGNGSLQIGSGASAKGQSTIALNGYANSNNDITIGSSAQVSGPFSIGIGGSITAAGGSNNTAIGFGAFINAQSATALGANTTASFTNSTAVGQGSTTTATNQVRLGNSVSTASVPGALSVEGTGTISNLVAGGGTAAVTLTNVSQAVRNQTVTNENVLSGTLTNVSLAVVNQTVTNQNVLQATITNANIAAVNLTATNLQALGGMGTNLALQNWTSTNALLGGSNRVNAIFFTRFDISTLGNSNNIAVPVGTNKFIRFTSGGLTAPANICGLVGATSSGGADGQELDCFNATTYNLVFSVNTVDPVAANRITSDSADITCLPNGTIGLKYNSATARWIVTALYPAVATATNAVTGVLTNGTSILSAGQMTVDFVSGVTGYVSGSVVKLGLAIASASGTNTLFQTNGTSLGTAGTVNWTTGVTGYLAGAVANLGLSAAGSGEANVNGEVSLTNATMFGSINGKAGVTNLLRSHAARYGLKGTNEGGTNISFAIDPAIIPSQTQLSTVSNQIPYGVFTFDNPFYNALNPFETPAVVGLGTNNEIGILTGGSSQSGLITSTDWNTFNQKTPTNRTITINGTANQITSSAGAQNLAGNRTWTLSTPQDIATGSTPVFAGLNISGTITGATVTATSANITGAATGATFTATSGNFSGTLTGATVNATSANVSGLVTNGQLQVAKQTNLNNFVLNTVTASRPAIFDANKQLTNASGTADATHYLDGTGNLSVPAGSAGSGLTTNANQFLGVPLSIIDGVKLTNAVAEGSLTANALVTANAGLTVSAGSLSAQGGGSFGGAFDLSGATLDGSLIPNSDNSFSLGNGSERWVNLHLLGNLTMYGSSTVLSASGSAATFGSVTAGSTLFNRQTNQMVTGDSIAPWKLQDTNGNTYFHFRTNGVMFHGTNLNGLYGSNSATPGTYVLGVSNSAPIITMNGANTSIKFGGAASDLNGNTLSTNLLIRTNGTTLGSPGTINWTTGVTGSISGSVATLGVSAAGSGGSSVSYWSNGVVVVSAMTNLNETVETNLTIRSTNTSGNVDTRLDTVQPIGTASQPQFLRLGLGLPADSGIGFMGLGGFMFSNTATPNSFSFTNGRPWLAGTNYPGKSNTLGIVLSNNVVAVTNLAQDSPRLTLATHSFAAPGGGAIGTNIDVEWDVFNQGQAANTIGGGDLVFQYRANGGSPVTNLLLYGQTRTISGINNVGADFPQSVVIDGNEVLMTAAGGFFSCTAGYVSGSGGQYSFGSGPSLVTADGGNSLRNRNTGQICNGPIYFATVIKPKTTAAYNLLLTETPSIYNNAGATIVTTNILPTTATSGTVTNGMTFQFVIRTNQIMYVYSSNAVYYGGRVVTSIPGYLQSSEIGDTLKLTSSSSNTWNIDYITGIGWTNDASVALATTSTITNTLIFSSTLDFPSTAAGVCSDLVIAATGVSDGDVASLGVPSASIGPIGGSFSCFTSNAAVYVRYCNNMLVTAQDPASGTFKVIVTKY